MPAETFTLPIDHSQFFIEDEQAADLSAWDLDTTYRILERDHLAPKPGGLVVATACQWGDVPVTVDVRADPPSVSLDDWDHAAEAGLLVESGRVSIYAPEMTGSDAVPYVEVPPGSYRALILYSGLESVPGFDASEGQEHYRVVLWPGETRGLVVHKRGFWCCRVGRHPT